MLNQILDPDQQHVLVAEPTVGVGVLVMGVELAVLPAPLTN